MKIIAHSVLCAAGLFLPATMATAASYFVQQDFGPTVTDFTAPASGNYVLASFDTSLGTLTGVSISYSFSGIMQGTLTNTAANAQSFQFTESSFATFNFSGAYSNSLTASIQAAQTYSNVASGGTVNFGAYTPSDTETVSPTSFASFLSNNVIFNVSTLTGQSFLGGGGNVHQSVNTTGSGYAKVTYTYDAAVAAVPEPAQWAMMVIGFGLLGTALRRSRSVAVSLA